MYPRPRAIILVSIMLLLPGFVLHGQYVDAGIVRDKLDCDGNYTNGQKRLFYEDLGGQRTVFRERILTIYVEKNSLVLSGDFFQGFPGATLQDTLSFRRIQEGEEYTFNCRISSYCEDAFIDGDLAFSDCTVSSEDYVLLDDVEDAASWWKRAAGVSDELAKETGESFFSTFSDGTMDGTQIGPSGADYAFEFTWRDDHLYVKKVSQR